MPKYIDAEALKILMVFSPTTGNLTVPEMRDILTIIDSAPSADVEPKQRWIPVTERLPENSKSVIIAHQNGVSTGWHNGRYWERGAATGHSKIKTVTHWMPLPEPPKGEEQRYD